MHPIKNGIYAFESVRWPGYFVQDLSVPFGSVESALKLKQTDLATAKAQRNLQFKLVKKEEKPKPELYEIRSVVHKGQNLLQAGMRDGRDDRAEMSWMKRAGDK